MYYAKLTRKELLFEEIEERRIDVSVARLRKKIKEDVKRPKYIRTVRNKGYIIYIYWKRFLSSLYKFLLMFFVFTFKIDSLC